MGQKEFVMGVGGGNYNLWIKWMIVKMWPSPY